MKQPSLSEQQRQNSRVVRRLYSVSLMSNAKWRSVFNVLDDDSFGIKQVIIQFIDVERPKTMMTPYINDLLVTPYNLTVVDSEFGPFPVVDIEWIEVPKVAVCPRFNNLPAIRREQVVSAVRSALLALGRKLPLEETSTGLRIVGHVRFP